MECIDLAKGSLVEVELGKAFLHYHPHFGTPVSHSPKASVLFGHGVRPSGRMTLEGGTRG